MNNISPSLTHVCQRIPCLHRFRVKGSGWANSPCRYLWEGFVRERVDWPSTGQQSLDVQKMSVRCPPSAESFTISCFAVNEPSEWLVLIDDTGAKKWWLTRPRDLLPQVPLLCSAPSGLTPSVCKDSCFFLPTHYIPSYPFANDKNYIHQPPIFPRHDFLATLIRVGCSVVFPMNTHTI
jgi:hypothetical protein